MTACQFRMKKILLSLLVLTAFSCTKQNGDFESDLMFHSVTLITEGSDNNEIKAAATIIGPNLCYQFTHLQVRNTRSNHFDIYAKGTGPERNWICAQALYQKDTTILISKPGEGTYTINFWNPNNQLFKSESIIIN